MIQLTSVFTNLPELIVVRPTTARVISTDIIRQTIVQHHRTSDLELTASYSVKLRLYHCTLKSRLKTYLFSTAFFQLLDFPVPPAPVAFIAALYKFCIIIIIIIIIIIMSGTLFAHI